MLPEPLGHGVRRAIRQQGDGLAALQVDEDRAVGVAFAQRPIVDAEHLRRGGVSLWLPAEEAQERVPADPQVPRVAEAYPGFPPQRDAERHQALGQAQGTARPGGRNGGQAFGEDAARAGAVAAAPFAHAQLKAHTILRPGQIGQRALVVTMDAPGRGGAQRTGCAGLGRAHAQGDLGRGSIDLARLQVQRGRIGQEGGKDVGGV